MSPSRAKVRDQRPVQVDGSWITAIARCDIDKVVERGAPVMANNLAQMLGHVPAMMWTQPMEFPGRPVGTPECHCGACDYTDYREELADPRSRLARRICDESSTYRSSGFVCSRCAHRRLIVLRCGGTQAAD